MECGHIRIGLRYQPVKRVVQYEHASRPWSQVTEGGRTCLVAVAIICVPARAVDIRV